MTRSIPACLLLLAGLAIFAAPANALSSRTFVSGKGADSASCGAVTSPCRTFQTAHDNTAAGGTIIVRDSGDYGPVHITKAISIVNDRAGTASVHSTGTTDGVLIDGVGPAGAVLLRGLSITGSGSGGVYGVEATNLGSLTIINCVVRGFNGGIVINGIDGPVSFSISHTIVAESNFGSGIDVSTSPFGTGAAAGVIDHVLAYRNSDSGIVLAGDTKRESVKATIIDSILSNNAYLGGSGLTASSGASATVRNVTASYNYYLDFGDDTGRAGYGFFFSLGSFSGSASRIAHSEASGNNYAFGNVGAIMETFGDNNFRGNTVDTGSEWELTPVAPQ